MALPSDVIEDRLAGFRSACERLGLKATHQRMAIYRELASTEAHPDAETIHRRVGRRIPEISRDTVYRNLNLLAEHGLISTVGLSHERLRFDANLGPHHHFVCVKCGLIRDFNSPGCGAIEPPAEAKAIGDPVSAHLEVKGVCRACRRAPGRRR